MERDEFEVARMLREATLMETMEPLSEKRRVQAEINAARQRFAGEVTRLPAQAQPPRAPSAQPAGYDPNDDPWTVDNLLQGYIQLPLRPEDE